MMTGQAVEPVGQELGHELKVKSPLADSISASHSAFQEAPRGQSQGKTLADHWGAPILPLPKLFSPRPLSGS